jgi:cytochrome c peroxidase
MHSRSLVLIALLFVTACSSNVRRSSGGFQPQIQPLPAQLSTYEPMSIPADNPMTPEKVALGRQLFFDERLSADGSRSCYSCHVCEDGLSDGLPKAIGIGNKQLPHNTQTLWNVGYYKEFGWDGRFMSVEEETLEMWTGPYMSAKPDEIVAKLNALQDYKMQFQKVFQSDATPDNVVKAIAVFERTIISGNTAWDRWKAADNGSAPVRPAAISLSAWRGWNIFQAIKCNNCHDGVLFTDQQFHNIGIGMGMDEDVDMGRWNVDRKPDNAGAFKTPTLRDVEMSAPYFHDGSAKTLEEAVDFMLGGGKPNRFLDKKNLEPHNLLPEQREDLLNFLRSLTVDCKLTKPPLPHK